MRWQPLHIEEAFQTTLNAHHHCRGGWEELVKHREGTLVYALFCTAGIYCIFMFFQKHMKKVNRFNYTCSGEWKTVYWKAACWWYFRKGTQAHRPRSASPHSLINFLIHSHFFLIFFCLLLCNITPIMWRQKWKYLLGKRELMSVF